MILLEEVAVIGGELCALQDRNPSHGRVEGIRMALAGVAAADNVAALRKVALEVVCVNLNPLDATGTSKLRDKDDKGRCKEKRRYERD